MFPQTLITFLLASICLTACVGRAPQHASPEIFLWSIAHASDQPPVAWILGSVHLTRESDGIDRAAIDAYAQCDRLAVELDTDALDAAELSRLIESSGHYEQGRSLRQALGDNDFERLSRLLQGGGLAVPNLESMKPWMAGMILGMTPLSASGVGVGVDRFFLARARGQKPIVSLETASEQFKAMAFGSERVQLVELRRMIEALERGESPLDEILDFYMSGDKAALESRLEGTDTHDGEHKAWLDRLFRGRNVHMAERAAALLSQGGKTFIVVGAAHLVGRDALQTMLAQRGFHILPVRATGERVRLELPTIPSASPVEVTGYRYAWPCPEPTSSKVDVGGVALPVQQCKHDDVMHLVSTEELPAAIAGLLSDDQLYSANIETIRTQVGATRVDQAPSTVATLSATGAKHATRLPAHRYELEFPGGTMAGVIVKAGTQVFHMAVMLPTGKGDSQVLSSAIESFALVLADP